MSNLRKPNFWHMIDINQCENNKFVRLKKKIHQKGIESNYWFKKLILQECFCRHKSRLLLLILTGIFF